MHSLLLLEGVRRADIHAKYQICVIWDKHPFTGGDLFVPSMEGFRHVFTQTAEDGSGQGDRWSLPSTSTEAGIYDNIKTQQGKKKGLQSGREKTRQNRKMIKHDSWPNPVKGESRIPCTGGLIGSEGKIGKMMNCC